MPGSVDSTQPDLVHDGVAVESLAVGEMLSGEAEGKPVVLVRTASGLRAIGGRCTHYGGALAGGLFDGTSVRCPRHHACFDVASGEAVGAPALDPVPAYTVRERDGRAFVSGPSERRPPAGKAPAGRPGSVLIVGAGAAGAVAAETLRREGYAGPITLIEAEGDGPVDRPNLSKDFLAGTAPEEWLPLRPPSFYREHDIELLTGRRVASIDPAGHALHFADGEQRGYGALLLATGAAPVRLDLPGGDLPHVHYLRSLADSRALVAAAEGAGAALVVGASFIGLEVAASLRARGLEVRVVAPDQVPMERVLGAEVGRLILSLHQSHGVRFHLGHTVREIHPRTATLDDGTEVPADLVVFGVGVRPRLELAAAAGLATENGVVVDRYLATGAPDVWAAGDIARWPHPRFGPIRVEHWVLAERHGRAVARNILGAGLPCDTVPFFWSQHYDRRLNYVGHATRWDEVRVEGGLGAGGLTAAYCAGGKVQAIATVGRDRQSLEAEVAFEGNDEDALARLAAGG